MDDRLQALIAEWRNEAAVNRSELERMTDDDQDADAEDLLARWNAYRKCADQLDALLRDRQAAPPQQDAHRSQS